VRDRAPTKRFVMRVPVAMVVSLVLVGGSVAITVAPGDLPSWMSRVLAGLALFGAIVYLGAAIRSRRLRP
jgi:hypothetical protein